MFEELSPRPRSPNYGDADELLCKVESYLDFSTVILSEAGDIHRIEFRQFVSSFKAAAEKFDFPQHVILRQNFSLYINPCEAEFSIDLHSFKNSELTEAIEKRPSNPRMKRVSTVLKLCRELQVAVIALSLGEPYRIWDLGGPPTASRDRAINKFDEATRTFGRLERS